jgi:hypothetical protein
MRIKLVKLKNYWFIDIHKGRLKISALVSEVGNK